MAYRDADLLVRYVRRLAASPRGGAPADEIPLERIIKQRDGVALELVMRRHGPMISRVCRRILGDSHLVEDAFQATFLVLLRRGASIRSRENLAGWLYRIAFRIALRARGQRIKIDSQASAAARAAGPEPLLEICQRELCSIIDEEINRLPERCRAPILCCYLEGRTRDEAAQQLQLPLRTLQRRLEEGRSLLRTRLARRGLTLSGAAIAGALAESSSGAAGFAGLLSRTHAALLAKIAGEALSEGALSLGAIRMAAGMARNMGISRIGASLCIGLATLVLSSGLGLLWAALTPTTENPEPPQGELAGEPMSVMPSDEIPSTPGIIKGVVVDEQDKPNPSAKVFLQQYVKNKPNIRQAAVDEQGRFQFDQVTRQSNGILDVLAYAEGKSYGGSLLSLAERQPPIQCTLRLTTPRQLKLRLVDQAGAPIQGVEVALLLWWTDRGQGYLFPVEAWGHASLVRPVSGPDGVLTIDRMPHGVTQVHGVLRHTDYALEKFQLNNAIDKVTELKLLPGVQTRFRLVNGITRQPVAGGSISIEWRQPDGIENLQTYYQPADEKGLSLVCLSPDRYYTVSSHHPDYASPEKLVSLRVTKEEADYALDQLPRARVAGLCLDAETGRPVANAQIFARLEEHSESGGSGSTSEGGNYEFDACVGRVRISAQASGYRGMQTGAIDVKERSLNLAPDLVLEPLPTIKGVVTTPDGKPARNIAVLGLNSGSALDVMTDANGEFLLPWQRFQGDIGVLARHPYQRLSGFATIQPLDENKRLRIQLQPEGTVRGSIVDAKGQPRVGQPVWLNVAGPGESILSPTLTDGQGRYQFTGLPRKCWYVVLGNARNYSSVSERFKLDDESVEVPALRNDGFDPRMVSTHPATAKELHCRAWLNSPALGIESLRGKIVLLYFWSYWDGLSPGFLPLLEQIHKRYGARGVVVIGVHQQGGILDEIKTEVKRAGVTFPIGLDNDAGDTFKSYGVDYPRNRILINRKGRIAAGDRFLESNLMDRVRHEVLYGEK